MSDKGSYIRAVEAHFLKYRGTGFVLSPKDEALVDSWYRKNIPLQNVLRGLDEAVTQMRERESRMHFRPRSISYFARSVEAHSQVAFSSSSVVPMVTKSSTKSVDLKGRLLRELDVLKKRLESQSQGAGDVHVIREKLEEASEDTLWGLLPALDSDLNILLSGLVPTGERESLHERARERVHRECGPYLSPQAREEQEAEAMAQLCRAHFDFDGLMALATGNVDLRD